MTGWINSINSSIFFNDLDLQLILTETQFANNIVSSFIYYDITLHVNSNKYFYFRLPRSHTY